MKFLTFSTLAIIACACRAVAEISINSTNAEFGYNGEMRGLSEKCAVAYSAKIQCSDLLFKFRNATKGPALYTIDNLTNLCKTECIDSLNAWDNQIKSSCTDKDMEQMEDPSGSTPVFFNMAIMHLHEIQENLYWPFCIKDQSDDSFCLIKSGLPAWPAKAADATKDSDFCKSSCRAQQSYILFSASGGSRSLATCPGADASKYPMNVLSEKAFGTAISGQNKVKQSNGVLKGTSYNMTTMFADYAIANVSAPTSTAALTPASSSTSSIPGSTVTNSTTGDFSGAMYNSEASKVLLVIVIGAFIFLQ